MTEQASNPIRDAIAQAIDENPVILFMKGTPDQPPCGFSARTVRRPAGARRAVRGRRHPARPAHPPGALGALELADDPAAVRQRRARRRRRHRHRDVRERRAGAGARRGAGRVPARRGSGDGRPAPAGHRQPDLIRHRLVVSAGGGRARGYAALHVRRHAAAPGPALGRPAAGDPRPDAAPRAGGVAGALGRATRPRRSAAWPSAARRSSASRPPTGWRWRWPGSPGWARSSAGGRCCAGRGRPRSTSPTPSIGSAPRRWAPGRPRWRPRPARRPSASTPRRTPPRRRSPSTVRAPGRGDARLVTHCNTGRWPPAGAGTALAVVLALHERGGVHVLVGETRPLLQGARLTVWELARAGVAHELVVDGAMAGLIRRGEVDAVVVGCDRVAANGDVANKVGTYPSRWPRAARASRSSWPARRRRSTRAARRRRHRDRGARRRRGARVRRRRRRRCPAPPCATRPSTSRRPSSSPRW